MSAAIFYNWKDVRTAVDGDGALPSRSAPAFR